MSTGDITVEIQAHREIDDLRDRMNFEFQWRASTGEQEHLGLTKRYTGDDDFSFRKVLKTVCELESSCFWASAAGVTQTFAVHRRQERCLLF